jgi:hypothetical protein
MQLCDSWVRVIWIAKYNDRLVWETNRNEIRNYGVYWGCSVNHSALHCKNTWMWTSVSEIEGNLIQMMWEIGLPEWHEIWFCNYTWPYRTAARIQTETLKMKFMVSVMSTVFRYVILCGSEISWPPIYIGFLCGLLFGLEDGHETFLRNVGLCPNYTALQPKRPYSSL